MSGSTTTATDAHDGATDLPPLPHPSPLTQPYWDACARGELAIQRCDHCARYVHLPEPHCPYCGNGELTFRAVPGRGRVHTFSVIHRTFVPGFAGEVPYVVAWVELDLPEGAAPQPPVKAFGRVVGCPTDNVRIGAPVEVCFEDRAGFGPIPNFRPATETAAT